MFMTNFELNLMCYNYYKNLYSTLDLLVMTRIIKY